MIPRKNGKICSIRYGSKILALSFLRHRIFHPKLSAKRTKLKLMLEVQSKVHTSVSSEILKYIVPPLTLREYAKLAVVEHINKFKNVLSNLDFIVDFHRQR